MLLKQWYNLLGDEHQLVDYLRQHGIMTDPAQANRMCDSCGISRLLSKPQTVHGVIRQWLRCNRKGCQAWRSIRTDAPFFHYTDVNGQLNSTLSLSEILELSYFWLHSVSQALVMQFTGKAAQTVSNWWNLCRDVACNAWLYRGMMGGQGTIVEVDEMLC